MSRLSRRRFFRVMSSAALGAGALPFLSRCGSATSGLTKSFANTEGSGHSHTLVLTCSTVDSPPAAGVTLTTSSGSGHTHQVTLSQSQLTALGAGTTLAITTDADATAHTHTFSVSDC